MSSNDSTTSKIGAMAQQAVGSTGSEAAGDRRRSSTNQFATITHHKRGSLDNDAQARKASFAEQTRPPGFFGGLFNSLTKPK